MDMGRRRYWIFCFVWVTCLFVSASANGESSPWHITCYTCFNVTDNNVCNRFAIDRACPEGKPFCHTVHVMDQSGDSVMVNKVCAEASQCTERTVGCRNWKDGTICVSCCDEPYCNEEVPTDNSNAILIKTRSASEMHRLNPILQLCVLIVTWTSLRRPGDT